jgi:hypothetical protein
VTSDTRHIIDDTLLEIRNGMPLNKLSSGRAGPDSDILPALLSDGGRFQAVLQQVGKDIDSEKLHAAVCVMDHEPFIRGAGQSPELRRPWVLCAICAPVLEWAERDEPHYSIALPPCLALIALSWQFRFRRR